MDEKTKLYIFTKKEVALIFLFMILIGCTAFILGVNVGKNYSFNNAGYTPEDQERIELLSDKEETVEKVIKQEATLTKDEQGQMIDTTYKRLEEEFKKLDSEEAPKKDPVKPKVNDNSSSASDATVIDSTKEIVPKDQYTGKFTIQLGSHRSMSDAEKFADGFRIRGYDPIIDEVDLQQKGIWYRVSLGVFETVKDAKAYVDSEKSLFSGTDYVFVQFD